MSSHQHPVSEEPNPVASLAYQGAVAHRNVGRGVQRMGSDGLTRIPLGHLALFHSAGHRRMTDRSAELDPWWHGYQLSSASVLQT